MAVFMSITALAIDAVLPALDLIGTSLGAKDANDSQLVIITLFVGMAIGLLLYGPLSDSYGRKGPSIWAWPSLSPGAGSPSRR